MSFSKFAVVKRKFIIDASSLTSCNGGTALGFRIYKYNNLVILDSTQDWKIYINIQGRGNTHSCQTNSNQYFYMECILYLSLGINSTPNISNEAARKIFTLYSFCINGSWDSDGDSLSYQLISPLLDSINQVTYNFPYNAANFIPSQSPITLHPISGEICMNLSSDFIGITKLQITEWRTINSQKVIIGVSQRDLLVHSYIVHNHPPILSGMDFNLTKQYNPLDTIYSMEFFAGDTIHFHINAYDIDSGLNSHCHNAHQLYIEFIYLDSALSSANIMFINNITDSAYVDFFWIPEWNDISPTPYNLSLRIGDHWRNLQQSGNNTFQYQLLIKQSPTTISENIVDDKLVFYPNPTDSYLNFELQKQSYKGSVIKIYDCDGRLVLTRVLDSNTSRIDIDDLKSGIYFIRLNDGKSIYSKKFIKI